MAEGYRDLREVPHERLTNPLHRRQLEAILSGKAVLDPAAAREMAKYPCPRYFLDYETVGPPVPIWSGTRSVPSGPVPVLRARGNRARCGRAPRGAAGGRTRPASGNCPRLIEAVGREGPIFTYTNYEATCTRNLAEACPDLEPALTAIIGRFVDLLPLTKNHYYHPAMQGSFSMKNVAPAIGPDLDYGALQDIAQGTQASEAYLEILHPDTSAERRQRLIGALLAYCKLDTWAMVRLAWTLEGRDVGKRGAD